MTRSIFACLALLASASTALSGAASLQSAAFLRSEPLAPLGNPDRVEVLRVETIGVGLSSTHRIVEQPIALDRASARRISGLLQAEGSYTGGASACLFQPVIAIRFHKGSKSVQALVCFFCDELTFERTNGEPLSDRFRVEKLREPLLAVARTAFPADPMFRNLP